MSTIENEIEIVDPTSIYNLCLVPPEIDKIKIFNFNKATYNSFFENFMLKNVPCVIQNISKDWECTKKWIKENNINWEFLKSEYSGLTVPVAECNHINLNSQCKIDMKFSQFVDYMTSSKREQILYLKDWHLRKVRPKDNFYDVPLLFGSDWLNEYAQDKQDDDFMFVYIGPQDSWTPIHADVYNSFSWSVNIKGRKKWVFFPPGEENKLKDSLGNLPLLFDQVEMSHVHFCEVIQEEGDAIFVPSGWHHQVENIMDTISINHNWVNGCNIKSVWNTLQQCLLDVEKEIEEFSNTPDYVDHCQLMLKALHGMNFESFIILICHIAKKRLAQLQEKVTCIAFKKYSLGQNHSMFDLLTILQIFNDIIKTENFFEKYRLHYLKVDFFNTKKEILSLDLPLLPT